MALPFALQMMIGIGIGMLGFLLLRQRYRLEEEPHHSSDYLPYNEEEQRQKYRSKPGDTCNICIEVMETFDMHFLPCRHAFHRRCFDRLIQNKIDKCPTCREKF